MNDRAVRPSPGKGRGVFAERDFAEGELVERCPVLVLDGRFLAAYGTTVIKDYMYSWDGESSGVALALGYGSLYNHSSTPNAASLNRVELSVMDFVAVRPIASGEEIVINYRYPADVRPPWYGPSS